MDGARDIVLISFPFAAGVALAQFCGLPLFHSSLALTSAIIILALGGKLQHRGWFALLFFCLGVLCGSTGICAPAVFTQNPFENALAATDAVIGKIPFSSEGNRQLVRALLTGRRDGLPRETVAFFRTAGASHILALSGLHMGIICILVGKLLFFLGNGRAGAIARSMLTVTICTFYALMTGASPSIVRALLFIAINEIMRHSPGRKKSPLALWCCALVIQLTVSPWVVKSVGFQLSYLAMLGIFMLYPGLEAFYPGQGRSKDPFKWMWNSMALSFSCQLFTAPLVWKVFHTFPKHFLLTNMIALPLTTVLVGCSAILILLGFAGLCPDWLAWTADTLAELLQGCLEIIAGM